MVFFYRNFGYIFTNLSNYVKWLGGFDLNLLVFLAIHLVGIFWLHHLILFLAGL